MKKTFLFSFIGLLLLGCSHVEYKTIPVKTYVSKMKAGWVGQMAGVGWGGPTEFRWLDKIIPEDNIPQWNPEMINQFEQDDIYVEMTFLQTLEKYGLDVSIRQAGIDFANSKYMLWHANKAGRGNLRSGIAPPFSGHPKFNKHADDIDYQIEADYSGLISPGLPQAVIDLGEKFGRIMNYGDGVYGGQFIAGMYAAAFFENDPEKIVQAGLKCIPTQSQYYEAINDVLHWYHEYPNDWKKTWQKIEKKYQRNSEYRKFCCTGPTAPFNIDAKLNGAYVVVGLLYGRGNLDQTIKIAMRCGMDSDCNPSSAGGVLATTKGFENLSQAFTSALDYNTKFSYTEYNFSRLTKVCEQLARKMVIRYGGKIEIKNGEEVFEIPVHEPVPCPFQQSWAPDSVNGDPYFTDQEMAQIKIKNRKPDEFIRLWQISGPYMAPGKTVAELLDVSFLPEKGGGKWQLVHLGENGLDKTNVQFHKIYGGYNRVAYASTRFNSESEMPAIIELGSDDGVKVWLNGKMVFENDVLRGCMPANDKVPINIKKGWNDLLFKVNQGVGDWEMNASLTDTLGNALTFLKYEF